MWGVMLLLGQLATLIFIVVAGLRQWRRGERQAALILLGGMSWFIIALLYEIVVETGLVAYVPLAETGFLGIAIALSLQMANRVIKTEEALARSERRLEATVAERTDKLQAAQAQLISQARETAVIEERRRIARDLHDEVTQTVYSASLITEVLPQVWERSPEEGRRNLSKLRQLVRGALAEMRTLLFELRPLALENASLDVLLPQLADAFSGRTRIPVEVMVDGGNGLPIEVKVAFYRIAQEALNNISKHADATEVSLTYEQVDDGSQLAIVDNGCGFEPAADHTEGMGLTNMQERAEAIRASLQLHSQPDTGTQLLLSWQPAANWEKEAAGQT
jgi:signal transduction histidine kinase